MAIFNAYKSHCAKSHSLLDAGAVIKGKQRRCRLCHEARPQTAKRAVQRAVNMPLSRALFFGPGW
jgi:hypothetical protein